MVFHGATRLFVFNFAVASNLSKRLSRHRTGIFALHDDARICLLIFLSVLMRLLFCLRFLELYYHNLEHIAIHFVVRFEKTLPLLYTAKSNPLRRGSIINVGVGCKPNPIITIKKVEHRDKIL